MFLVRETAATGFGGTLNPRAELVADPLSDISGWGRESQLLGLDSPALNRAVVTHNPALPLWKVQVR